MGAKKLLSSPTKTTKSPTKANNKTRTNDTSITAKTNANTKNTATKARTNTPPIKPSLVNNPNKREKDDCKIIAQKPATAQKAVANPKAQLKKSTARSASPRKSPFRQIKIGEDKSKALSKVIKNLDIKISGFKAIVPEEQKIECKASISEIVKTKSRAASAKISPGPLGKTVKPDDDPAQIQKTKTSSDPSSSESCEGEENDRVKPLGDDQKVDKTIPKGKDSCKKVNDTSSLTADLPSTECIQKDEGQQKSSLNEGYTVEKSQLVATTKKMSKAPNVFEREKGKNAPKKQLQFAPGTAMESIESAAYSTKPTNKKQTDTAKDEKTIKHSNKQEKAEKAKATAGNKKPPVPRKKKALITSAPEESFNKNKQASEMEKDENSAGTNIDSTATKSKDDSIGDTGNLNEQRKNEDHASSHEIEKTRKRPEKKNVKATKTDTKLKKASAAESKTANNTKEKVSTATKKCSNMPPKVQVVEESSQRVEKECDSESLTKTTTKSILGTNINCRKSSQSITDDGVTENMPNDSLNQEAAEKPENTSSKKIISVRERLQKKYAGNQTTFKAFKAKKQTSASKKSAATSPRREQTRSPSKKSLLAGGPKIGDDIYDFKTESESDDNIKMNLIIESSMLSKLSKLAKATEKAMKKEEDDAKDIKENVDKVHKEETQDVNQGSTESQKEEVTITVKEKDKCKTDKDFSDEDDRPLQQTKKLLDDAKQDKAEEEKKLEEKSALAKVKEEAKPETKKPSKNVKASKAKPVKKVTVIKRKGKAESTNSDDSENDDSDETSSSSSESCLAFGPKRHRMASLNALAKVQCLYENESRTAHELGLSKSSQAPKMRVIASGTSSDEEDSATKKLKKEEHKEDIIKEEDEEESSAPEEENKRELRNAPGMRGVGKHWEFNDASSFESGHESDITFKRGDDKSKPKKRKIVKPKIAAKSKEKVEAGKAKKAAAAGKAVKKKVRPQSSKENSESSDESESEKNQQKKRKREKTPELKVNVTSKRMASLNASAIVAATYEVERHLDRNLDSDCSSFESLPDDVKAESAKKSKELSGKADPADETPKDNSRPTSTSVVIVQDTDVTITGVYVNSATGAGQEAYCKMQYRVQSSVTEERVLRPNSIDPPKSYTPLSALSSMRPPGTDTGQVASPEDLSPVPTQQTFQPTIISRSDQYPPPSVAVPQQQQQSNAHMYGQHHHHHGPPLVPQPPSQEQMHHMHHQQSPPKYHHMHHHHHQQPPLAQPRCESPMRYAPGTYQNVQPPMPPPPNSISISGGGSSAFCAPSIQQSHHDISGYYQPAGPLISQHVLPSAPGNNSSLIVSTKQIPSPIDPERDHQLSQLQHQSTTASDNPDNDILITGGDLTTFRYPSQQSQQGPPPQSQALSTLAPSQGPPPQQGSPYSRQIHPMHYPPYQPSYYSPYPGEAMCYPPPYQHYFPAKVYQTAPTYRRYSSYFQPGPPPPPSELYDPQAPPSNAAQPPPPPQSGSQLVPTGPGGPQHIEHYTGPPGYYTSYNPGGGECYPPRGMQPPYMEYPAPCPCPMQSCPKNVLTGPLIGSNSSNSVSNSNLSSTSAANGNSSASSNSSNSITSNGTIASHNTSSLSNLNQQLKTSKGPVRTHNNHLIGQHDQAVPAPGSNLPGAQPGLGQPLHHQHHHHLQCKRELIETLKLKSEIKSDVMSEMIAATETRKTGQYEETVVPPTPPSLYTINDKLTEPEATPSPARGSTGPQTVPEKSDESASQTKEVESRDPTRIPPATTDYEHSNTHVVPTIGRKARIGKSMAREMMYGAHALNPLHQLPPALNDFTQSRKHQHQPIPSHNVAPEASVVTPSKPPDVSVGPDVNRIKKEEIKVEEEDDVVILEEEVKLVKSEPDVVEVIDKLSDVENEREVDGDATAPRAAGKRMNILDSKSACRKSTLNGYKSLIKQTEPKSYLCLSAAQREKRSLFRKYSKGIARSGIRKRKLVLTEQQKKRLSIRKRNLIMMEKDRQQRRQEKLACEAASNAAASRREATCSAQERILNRVDIQKQDMLNDCTNDGRGYFSEPDIRTSTSRKIKKTRSNEARSKSETKKSKISRKGASNITSGVITNGNSTSSEMMPKLPESMVKMNSATISRNGKMDMESRASKKSKNPKKKAKCPNTPADESQNECYSPNMIDFHAHLHSSPTPVARMDTDERMAADVCLSDESFNNHSIHEDANCMDTLPVTTFLTSANFRTSTCGKRSRPRGHRFSKKRPKYRRYQTEVDDSIIPRKSNAVPKWNNGWSWLGEPFQAKVFLNSDDPLVIRTCYPAMRHMEGDIIRPRDCVLLKAGNKKNELPYVAKVAHLWENPEDGEMMMSLLWYYRPEHTEQGRQPNDCSDEVFASRHRDHNSVACIEDKCYVLTFSEYCRYRKRVRAAEEGIEMENRIIPQLKTICNPPKVPVTTNPEQVMFCQRVYEFRQKRLLKTPTN